jgi:hypothetical protein
MNRYRRRGKEENGRRTIKPQIENQRREKIGRAELTRISKNKRLV